MTALLLKKPSSPHFVVWTERLETETGEGGRLFGMRRQKALETKMPVFFLLFIVPLPRFRMRTCHHPLLTPRAILLSNTTLFWDLMTPPP